MICIVLYKFTLTQGFILGAWRTLKKSQIYRNFSLFIFRFDEVIIAQFISKWNACIMIFNMSLNILSVSKFAFLSVLCASCPANCDVKGLR